MLPDAVSRSQDNATFSRPMTNPDILYVLSHGFAARMVLHSDLLPELRARGMGVAALAPNGNADHFRELCARRGVEPIQAPPIAGLLFGQYGEARRYVFEDYERNAALRAKHQWEVCNPDARLVFNLRSRLGKVVNSALLRAPRTVRLLGRVEPHLLRSSKIRELLRRRAPKLVVATYPVNWLEALTVLEARRLGIPTVGQLLSWDNITCKGRFAAVPDRFISWGPIMTDELGQFYGATGDSVLETGVAHFDMHLRAVEPPVLAGHLRALALDPERPYLFFGMSASFFAPKEVDIVAWMAERVRAGAFGEGIQLLVRPHPQNIRGNMADPKIIARLNDIAGGPVAVDLPEVVGDGLDMAERDMARLAALLHGAAVTLNSGSTLTIDAMLHDRPVVLTAFDADEELPWWGSARRLVEFPHLKKLLSYGGVEWARSFVELERAVRSYIEDPTKDREARRRALEAECGVCDGRACERIADGLAELIASSPR